MDDPVFDRIELDAPVTLPVWDFDPLTFQPMFNPDGTRKHALVGIGDEVMEVHDSGPGWALVKRGTEGA